MVRINKKIVEKLKKEDKGFKDLKKEEKIFKKGENFLKKLVKPQPIEIDLKELEKAFRKKR